jgi:hypothetical protein
MEIHGWNLIHSTVISLQSQNKHKHIFDLIEKFLLDNFKIEDNILTELMILQRTFLIDYNEISSYPKIIEFKSDILGYVQEQISLDTPAKYEFDFPEDKEMSVEQFCEQIFFARRRNFGKAWVTKV